MVNGFFVSSSSSSSFRSSPSFASLLTWLTKLEPLRCATELRRFTAGCYTLAQDLPQHDQEKVRREAEVKRSISEGVKRREEESRRKVTRSEREA